MTFKNKLILGVVALVVTSAGIQGVWETQADQIQNIWSVFSDTQIPKANIDASMFLSFLTLISIYFLRKLFLLLGWFKKKKRLKNNFKSVVNNAPNKIGVYIARLEGKVKYVGRAIENRDSQSTSGLRKRLQEHYRGGHTGSESMFTYKDEINIETITTDTVDEAKELEARLIRKFDTVNDGWNKCYAD